MSDNNEPDSSAPIQRYDVVGTPLRQSEYAGRRKTGKPTTRRQRKRMSKKKPRSSVNMRQVLSGLFLLGFLFIVVYSVMNPDVVTNTLNGNILDRTERCEVVKTNQTLFFETSCGVFEWDDKAISGDGKPANSLTVGEEYSFSSTGIRIPLLDIFPSVWDYQPA